MNPKHDMVVSLLRWSLRRTIKQNALREKRCDELDKLAGEVFDSATTASAKARQQAATEREKAQKLLLTLEE